MAPSAQASSTEDDQLRLALENYGYLNARRLESGEIAGLAPFLFTVGLCVGVSSDHYRCRFCFPDYNSALEALDVWDGYGAPPGKWIAHKGMDLTMRTRPEDQPQPPLNKDAISTSYRM